MKCYQDLKLLDVESRPYKFGASLSFTNAYL